LLKLTLEKGRSFERQAEAAGKFLAKLLEEAVREGWIRIYAYPRPDSVITAAALYAAAASAGARPIVGVSIDPPRRIDVPTVLIGYGSLDYGTVDVDAPLAAFAPEIRSSPPPNSIYVDGDSSNPGLLGAALIQVGGLYFRRDVLGLVLAGIHYGGKMDKVGKVYGVDSLVVSSILESRVLGEIKVLTSLKAYKPTEYSTCRSIGVTVNPYYPGLTGYPEECAHLLAAAGLERLASKRLEELDDDDLKSLVRTVVAAIQDTAGVEVDVKDYIGGFMVSRAGKPSDYRMLADALVYSMEWSRSIEPLLAAASGYDDEIPILERLLEWGAPRMAKAVEEARPVRLRAIPWLRAYVVNSDLPQLFLRRALRITGKLEEEAVIVYEDEGKYIVSAFQIEEALGYGQLKRLKNAKAVEGDGIFLKVRGRS